LQKSGTPARRRIGEGETESRNGWIRANPLPSSHGVELAIAVVSVRAALRMVLPCRRLGFRPA
jgi:hypothetical protein